MKLPQGAEPLVPKAKIVGYLLAGDHPVGGHKAEFFTRFGFAVERWEQLAAALKRHGGANAVTQTIEVKFGTLIAVEGPLKAPDGRSPWLRSVWIHLHGQAVPRLATAYPIKRRRYD